jgi:hypothetical protein
MKKPLHFWSWILCALWMSAAAQADSPTDEASNDTASAAPCACAASCNSKQECEEADCPCAQKEVLPTDPNPLKLSDNPAAWSYQAPTSVKDPNTQ